MGETTDSSAENEVAVEDLLSEKQKLLNCCLLQGIGGITKSKDEFVKKLRQLLTLERRLSRRKRCKKST